MGQHAELLKDTIFQQVSHRVDTEVQKQRLDLRRALKSHGDKLMARIGRMEDQLVIELFEPTLKAEPLSSGLESEQLREFVAGQVREWRQFKDFLTSRLPKQSLRYEKVMENSSGGSDAELDGSDGAYAEKMDHVTPEPVAERKRAIDIDRQWPSKIAKHVASRMAAEMAAQALLLTVAEETKEYA